MNRRIVFSFAGAVAVTLALFWLMQALVDSQPGFVYNALQASRLETTRLIADPPPPPPLPEPPPQEPAVAPASRPAAAIAPETIAPPVMPAASVALPTLDLKPRLSGRPQSGVALSGFAKGQSGFGNAAGSGEGFTGTDLVPISSTRPKYPRSAIERGLEGWVEVIFRIASDGRISAVRIIDAEPRGVFEDAAIAAVSQWIYAPYYRNGKPVQREATQRLEFRLADVQPLFIWED